MFDLVPWRKQQKGDVSRLHHEFDDLFNRFFRRDFAVPGDPLGKELWFPTTDILEDKKKITLKAEELNISATGRNLTISRERKIASEGENVRYHRREREDGKFKRIIALPGDIQVDKIATTAKFSFKILPAEKAY